MKVTDLMLNDLVLYRDKVAKVIAITANGEVSLLVDGHIVARFVYAEELSPIPITPEILAKNGLSKLVTYGTEKWVCDKFRLNEYDNKGVWRFCAYTNRNEDSVIYIRYVHDLQRALKLCGIEKEITL